MRAEKVDVNNLYMTIPSLPKPKHGKVRDIYDLGDKILFVASDRISAFDYIMPNPIPQKGKILTGISEWWFRNTEHILKNHLLGTSVDQIEKLSDKEKAYLSGRAMIVEKAITLPIEFIVRGFIAGSGWIEYQATGEIHGNKLPAGLEKESELPEPIFTPSTKADQGHDQNISYSEYERIIQEFATEHNIKLDPAFLKSKVLELFTFGSETLKKKGILLADTKFELGLASNGEIILIDEALTPDSSRFWLMNSWEPGDKRINYDKQILRDWLEASQWDKQTEPPELPQTVIEQTSDKYKQAFAIITGQKFV